MTDYQFAVVMWWLISIAFAAWEFVRPAQGRPDNAWVAGKLFLAAQYTIATYHLAPHFIQGYFGA